MLICKKCEREYPFGLIQELVNNEGRVKICPICALELINKIHGFPPDTPFRGEMARDLYDEAVEYNTLREIEDG